MPIVECIQPVQPFLGQLLRIECRLGRCCLRRSLSLKLKRGPKCNQNQSNNNCNQSTHKNSSSNYNCCLQRSCYSFLFRAAETYRGGAEIGITKVPGIDRVDIRGAANGVGRVVQPTGASNASVST